MKQIAAGVTGQIDAASFLQAVRQAKNRNVNGLILGWTPSNSGLAPYTRISNAKGYYGTLKDGLAYFRHKRRLTHSQS